MYISTSQKEDKIIPTPIEFVKQLEIEDFTKESQDKLQEYICPLCKGIYFDPVLDSCAHIFCKKCFMIYLGNESSKKCPIGTYTVDKSKIKEFEFISEIIKRQEAYCINKAKGCNWAGVYIERTEHAESHCEYQQIKCKNEGCNLVYLRKEMQSHDETCLFKLTQCSKCNQEIVKGLLMTHRSECPKEELICICEQLYFRDTIDKHKREECPSTKINCQYSLYGCLESFIRSEQQKHNNQSIEKHNQMVLKWINETKMKFDRSYDKQYKELNEKTEKVSAIYDQLLIKCKQYNININNSLVPN